jgi:hypothetical protein
MAPHAARTFGSELKRWLLYEPAPLRGLSWRRVGYTFLVASGFALYGAGANWMLQRFGSRPRAVGLTDLVFQPWGLVTFEIRFLVIIFTQMLAMTIADNGRATGIARVGVLTLALANGTVAGELIVAALLEPEIFDLSLRELLGETTLGTVGAFARAALVAIVYFKWRHDRQIAAQFHQAELARVELQRKTLESDLQTMQAQVEPQFLFNTLERVEALYESDFASADRTLDSLIVYLRAALPRMRSSHSTLGQEVELVRAYLDIERSRAANDLALDFDVPEALAAADFPPMVLLPLVQSLVAREPGAAGDTIILKVMARQFDGGLKVALTRTSGPAFGTAHLEDLRRRLSVLYGAAGKLIAERSGATGLSVDLRIPLSAPEVIAL